MRNALRNREEVAHYWAHQVQKEGRASSLSFNGPVLYSYAEPIARIVDDLVLLNDRSYSMTTSIHQGLARRAASHRQCMYVPYVGHQYEPMEVVHECNRTMWLDRLESTHTALKNHPRRKVSLTDRILDICRSMNDYSLHFGLLWPAATPGWAEEVLQQRVADALERKRLAAEREEKARLARIQEEVEDLAAWRRGETVCRMFEVTALRIKGNEIETTHGARIPDVDAIRLWPKLCMCKRAGVVWRPEQRLTLGSYEVTSFNGEELVVGCHTIPWAELAAMASLLQLPPYEGIAA